MGGNGGVNGGQVGRDPSAAIRSVLSRVKPSILNVASSYGARNIRVFGSVARGDARRDSDVDLLVDFTSQPSLLQHVGLALDLERVVGRKVDVVTERELRPSKRRKVLREAVAL